MFSGVFAVVNTSVSMLGVSVCPVNTSVWHQMASTSYTRHIAMHSHKEPQIHLTEITQLTSTEPLWTLLVT